MDTVITYLTLSFVVSFLLGSIPWGVIVSKLAFHKDIRDEGSGNIGATNAFRAMGKVGGALVFVLDFGKGLFVRLARGPFVFAPGHSPRCRWTPPLPTASCFSASSAIRL